MRKPRLRIEILAVADIEDSLKHELYRLFEKYYVDVSWEMFGRDLAEKTHVLLLWDRRRVAGFSTILKKRMPELGRGVFLFSGDTVMHRDYWGSKRLQMAFFRYIVASKLQAPFEPLYWMLISKGYKTYLLMRRNFPLSFPNGEAPTPEAFRKVADGFYRQRYGDAYSPASGLIRFETSHGAVRGTIAVPRAEDLEDPSIRFFADRNPDYARGVELACVAEIRFQDFARHLNKYFLPFRRAKARPAALASDQRHLEGRRKLTDPLYRLVGGASARQHLVERHRRMLQKAAAEPARKRG
jgi:hypothetical protein